MGVLMRAARATGESVLFDGNGPAVWNRVRRAIENLLEAFWREGALAGDTRTMRFRCAATAAP